MNSSKKNNQDRFSFVKDNVVFLREAILEFKDTGTLFPTSRWAAEALVDPLLSRQSKNGMKLLELGPGTGSVTVQIISHMQMNDELTIVEINPRFLEVLKERLATNPDYLRHKDRIKFYGCAVQDLPEVSRFDLIICAIPFLNLDVKTVEEIFGKLRRMSHAETLMTYYEFMGLRSLGLHFSPPKRKQRLQQVDSFFRGSIYPNHLCQRIKVYLNLLPINVYMLKDIDSLPVAA